MLSKVVTDYLEKRFPDKIERVEPTEGYAPFLRIKPEARGFGDIELYDDGDEVTIFFGRFTHSHYANYEDISKEEKELHIAEDVFEALDNTFNDRYEFWGSHKCVGGFQNAEYANGQKRRIISRIFSRASSRAFYRWSGATRKLKS